MRIRLLYSYLKIFNRFRESAALYRLGPMLIDSVSRFIQSTGSSHRSFWTGLLSGVVFYPLGVTGFSVAPVFVSGGGLVV